MKKDKDVEALAKKKLAELLSVIDEKSILTVQKGKVLIGGVAVSDEQLKNLRSEADFLTMSSIWPILIETIRSEAQKAMFVSSETLADMVKGKSMLFTLKTQENLVQFLKSYKQVE